MKSRADRYIEDVLKRVVLPTSRRQALEADLREHFSAAEEGHEPVEEVIRRLGTAEEVAASFMEGVELRFAGIWARIFALFADLGFCLLSTIPAIFFGAALRSSMENEAASFVSFVLFCFFVLFALGVLGIFILYFPIFEHFFGWTLGKRLLKLRVVTEQGAAISLGAAFIRRLPFYFELIWLDGIFAPFTEKKQRAFDMVAKTIVIREPEEQATLFHYLLCFVPWVGIAGFALFFAIARSAF